jgi:hypothetical protein
MTAMCYRDKAMCEWVRVGVRETHVHQVRKLGMATLTLTQTMLCLLSWLLRKSAIFMFLYIILNLI